MLAFVYIVISPLLFLSFLLRILPSPVLCSIGRGTGRLLKRVGFRTRIVSDNLQLALAQEMNESELQKLQTRIFENTGITFLQILRNFTLSKKRALREVYMSDKNISLLNALKAQNKGAVVLSAHIACWELFPVAMAARGYSVCAVVKRISSRFYQTFVEHRRSTAGFSLIYSGNTFVHMKAAIAEGKLVGFMMDQHINGRVAIETTFFGAPASSIKGLAQFARETNCLILPMCLFRRADGTHELYIAEPLKYIEGTQFPENSPERLEYEIQVNSQNYQDAVEAMVRKNLDQWLWIHRRWKLAKQKVASSI